MDEPNGGLELNFIHDCRPFLIKYTIKENTTHFGWRDTSGQDEEFRPLATLVSDGFTNLTDLFSSRVKTSLFCFHILTRERPKNGHSASSTSIIDPKLWDLLFQSKRTEPIVIAGSHDGYLYWSHLVDNCRQTGSLQVLMNTSMSPVVGIGSFLWRSIENNLFESSKPVRIPNSDNCLYVVTKSGKAYVYYCLPDGSISLKICILAHFVESCVRYSFNSYDYLIYSTNSNEIYAVRLVDCLKNAPVRSKFVKKFTCVHRLTIDAKSDEIIVKTSLGSEKLDLDRISSLKPNEVIIGKNLDKAGVKQHMVRLCEKSNEIVKHQRKLDKLNFVLKQLNQIQSIRMNTSNAADLFEIHKCIRRGQSSLVVGVEIELVNKSMRIENDSHYLLVCVRFEKLGTNQSSYWKYKFEKLRANSHKVFMDSSGELNRQYYPRLVKVCLVYDVRSFLVQSDEMDVENLSEFCVCLYESEFKIDEFFGADNLNENRIEPNMSQILWNVFGEYYKKYNFSERLNEMWKSLSIQGLIGTENLFSGKTINLLDETKELKTWGLNSTNQSLQFSRNREDESVWLKIDMASTSNRPSLSSFRRYLTDLIYFKNQCLKTEIYQEINDIWALRPGTVADIVDESIQTDENMKEEPIENSCFTLKTLLSLFKIYLKLRNLIYSDCKFH